MRKVSPECPICIFPYNRGDRLPIFLCSNTHTICRQCLNEIRYRSPQCPFCRQPIDFDRLRTDHQIARKIQTEGLWPQGNFQDDGGYIDLEKFSERTASFVPGILYPAQIVPGFYDVEPQPIEHALEANAQEIDFGGNGAVGLQG